MTHDQPTPPRRTILKYRAEGGNEIATSSREERTTFAAWRKKRDKEAARVKAIYDRAPDRREQKKKKKKEAVCGFQRPVDRGCKLARRNSREKRVLV